MYKCLSFAIHYDNLDTRAKNNTTAIIRQCLDLGLGVGGFVISVELLLCLIDDLG